MPHFHNLPIMPKESKTPISLHASLVAPYPTPTTAGPRTAAIWCAADDDKLLQARASGLNWQPIASQYFPNKSANACRKRHERLIERRQASDWDAEKLDRLAQEYIAMRREMWETLAAKLGERWNVVEAKCMEKGLKTLQAMARTAERRNTGSSGNSFDDQGIQDHHSDSAIGLGSDAEMELDEPAPLKKLHSSWHATAGMQSNHQEHVRSRSLPQPLPPQLPLYQPPPPIITHYQPFDTPMTTSPATMSFIRSTSSQRCSPDSQNGRGGISIQSVLSPPEQCV